MKKTLFTVLILSLVSSACLTPSRPVERRAGINYEEYERARQKREKEREYAESLAARAEVEEAENLADIEIDIQMNEAVKSLPSVYGDSAVIMAVKKITLGENASQSDMQNLQKALDRAYKKTLLVYREAGFAYSISPWGAVNPLSVIDVQCVLSESLANAAGKSACDLFLKLSVNEYLKESALAQEGSQDAFI
jgi:hypothetical protein